jgi:hypothetical protein
MSWAFALIVSALSVFTLAPEGRSAANPATALAATSHAVSAQAFSSQISPAQVASARKPGATRTHTNETGTLLSSRSSATLQKLLTGFVDHYPENNDTDHGLNVTLPDTASLGSVAAQQARFYFLVSSIHEAPYSPRSPPCLA